MELVQSETWVFRHPVTSDKKLWSQSISVYKNQSEYSDILYNPTHFPGPFMCWIRQVPLYYVTLLIQTVVHTLSLAETFSINHIQDNFVRYMNMYSTALKKDFKFSFKSSCNRVDNIKLKVCSQIIHQCNMESVEPVNLYHRWKMYWYNSYCKWKSYKKSLSANRLRLMVFNATCNNISVIS